MPGEGAGRDLQAELDAERAATAHWRQIARRRSSDFADLRHRPIVRAALALERRLHPIRRAMAGIGRRLRALLDPLVLASSALGRRPGRALAGLQARLPSLAPPAADARKITLVMVGSNDLRAPPRQLPVEVVVIEPSADPVGAVRHAIEESGADLVGIILATSEPLDDWWLARLARAVRDDVVAATPLLVHPRRPRTQGTPHDGRVRAAGLVIDVVDGGTPVVWSAAAGSAPDPTLPDHDVAAGSAACLLFDRAAYDAAGGLAFAGDLDVAAVELCVGLRARGGRIVVVPGAVVADHRPVRSRRDLRSPIDPAGEVWRAAIDRSGPALFRSGPAPAR